MQPSILTDQIAYYRARAAEYDEWFERKGRYDRGEADNAAWHHEAHILREALRASGSVGDTLELACGTGIWTRELATLSERVTAVDAAPEMLAINQAKIGDLRVTYEQADLFSWEPDRTYDRVFFAFWLSHVPPEQFTAFFAKVRRALKPMGQLFIIDSLDDPTSSASNHSAPDKAQHTHLRVLNDGQSFTIVKVFYDPAQLHEQLTAQGFEMTVHNTGRFFWFADGVRR